MRNPTSPFVFLAVLALAAMSGCGPGPSPTPAAPTGIPPTISPTLTPLPQGETITVTSTDDSGSGSLRQALQDAQPGDTIAFDRTAFPPEDPASIPVASELPWLSQGYVTIDASDAGVILDGGLTEGQGTPGLSLDSEWNTIRGLQIVHFGGVGIVLWEHAAHNVIGGDPDVGLGLLGQGNLISANADGIALSGAVANTLAGNRIGTDALGTSALPNRYTGIFLMHGSQGNVIGPANTIAFNGESGIEIRPAHSTGNTITRNSIYRNGGANTYTASSDALTPSPPVILEFDLQDGIAKGITCRSCVVEVFSGEGDNAEVYEGTATADQDGAFVLMTGIPFRGPALRATATSIAGSTSTFSLPTWGENQLLALQDGNTLLRSPLQARASGEVEDNRLSTHTEIGLCPRDMYDQCVEEIAGLGLTRVRLSLNEFELPFDPGRPELSIDPIDDRWITNFVDHGLAVTYVLSFWDKEYQAEGGELGCPRFRTEDEIQRYLDFARFAVGHFSDRVQDYEIWNEPDAGACPQSIKVEDYINVVRRVVPVIRQEYPAARVVVGAVSGLHDARSQEYLLAIVDSDIMAMVDAVSWHPFYGASPQYADMAKYYSAYPSLVWRIQDLATAAGFQGEFRADEMTWRTPVNARDDQPWTYSETAAAKYYARAVVMHLGLGVAAGVAADPRQPIIFSTVQNLAAMMPDAQPIDLPIEVEGGPSNTASYTFALPNGDELIALWTDGAAQDDDPGTGVTLVVFGRSAKKVIAMDVLRGYEHQLVTNDENGNLVIPDLVLRDYPIILRLIP